MNHMIGPALMFGRGSTCRKPRFWALGVALLVGFWVTTIPTVGSAALIIDFATAGSMAGVSPVEVSGRFHIASLSDTIDNVSSISSIEVVYDGVAIGDFNPGFFGIDGNHRYWGVALGGVGDSLWLSAGALGGSTTWADVIASSPFTLGSGASPSSITVSSVNYEFHDGTISFTQQTTEAIPEPSVVSLFGALLLGSAVIITRRRAKRRKCEIS